MRIGMVEWQGVGEDALGWRGYQEGEKRVHVADGCRPRSGCEVTAVCRADIEPAQAHVGKYRQCRRRLDCKSESTGQGSDQYTK